MNTRFLTFVAILALLNFYSCKKEDDPQQPETPPVAGGATKFKFLLYTSRDFSSFSNIIHFKMYIRNNRDIIVDSSLVSMRVKDVPDAANKLVFERTVQGNYEGIYKAGIIYTIEDVGMSWHFDSCRVGTPEKTIDFNFR